MCTQAAYTSIDFLHLTFWLKWKSKLCGRQNKNWMRHTRKKWKKSERCFRMIQLSAILVWLEWFNNKIFVSVYLGLVDILSAFQFFLIQSSSSLGSKFQVLKHEQSSTWNNFCDVQNMEYNCIRGFHRYSINKLHCYRVQWCIWHHIVFISLHRLYLEIELDHREAL